MLRCNRCGGHALATLGHLHCLTEHLCLSCTQKVVEAREKREKNKRPLPYGDFTYEDRRKAA